MYFSGECSQRMWPRPMCRHQSWALLAPLQLASPSSYTCGADRTASPHKGSLLSLIIAGAQRCNVLCFAALQCAMLCCGAVCCSALQCAVLSSAVLCCAVLCCAVLCCAVLCCAMLCCAAVCCAVLCCAVLNAMLASHGSGRHCRSLARLWHGHSSSPFLTTLQLVAASHSALAIFILPL